MNRTLTHAAMAPKAARPRTATTLRSFIADWRWRLRFRRELKRKATDDPRLIDDLGLTKRQVEAEIAKPFWRR